VKKAENGLEQNEQGDKGTKCAKSESEVNRESEREFGQAGQA